MTDLNKDRPRRTTVWEDASDTELWGMSLAGGSEAFAVLFDRHRRRVFRHAYRYSASVPDAEDVVAVVFLETWRRRRDVTVVDDSLLPWLLAVSGFVILNARRSARRRDCLLAALPRQATPDPADLACVRIDDEIRSRSIRDALSRLSLDERRLVALCIMEDVTVASAAIALGVPLATAKSRLRRAKAKLRADPLLQDGSVTHLND